MTIDPKVFKANPIVVPWEVMITSHRQDPSLIPWKDTGKIGWMLDFTVQVVENTPAWLIFAVCAEELLVRARKHGLLWDPHRVKFSGGIEKDDSKARKDRRVYIEGIHLDHPAFMREKP